MGVGCDVIGLLGRMGAGLSRRGGMRAACVARQRDALGNAAAVSAPLTGQLCEVCAPGKSWETSMATDRGRVCAADKESGCAGGAHAALGNRYGHGKPAAD